MPRPSDLADYLDGLRPSRRELFSRLMIEVSAIATPPEISRLVFRAGQSDHPEYDDAEMVFWKAAEQMYLREAVSDGDLPLMFWGFHLVDLLGRRHSKGVLVTDRTVYVEGVDEEATPLDLGTLDAAAVRIDADALHVGTAHVGLARIEEQLAPADRPAVARYLSAVIDTVRRTVAAAGAAAPDESPATVEELVLASRLSADFLLPSRPKNAKGLAKLAAKWKLPSGERLLASLSSATFAGVYGVAVTDQALYSRDLMEDVHRTPLAEVGAIGWDAEAKGFRIAADHLAPAIPTIDEGNRDYAAALLTSVARSAAQTG
ncbi:MULTISPECIES: hypothetical protein [unclassified Microbacterium]|uniref:hypothetical protein n=1 Tax=unclassified Microbacterium TaxID=2609290 RepID=UPI00386EE33A